MNDEWSMFFEVVCCGHPTERDAIGCDGMYVKDVRRIADPALANERIPRTIEPALRLDNGEPLAPRPPRRLP